MTGRLFAVLLLLSPVACNPLGSALGHERRTAELELRVATLEVEILELRAENDSLARELEELRRERPALLSSTRSVATESSRPGPIAARCTGSDDERILAPADSETVVENLAGLAMEVRIVPYFQDGRATGFKLFSIRPDSFLASCGFRNGDVIRSVNGDDVSSPEKALGAYEKAKDAERMDFEIVRGGKPARVVIAIQ